MARETLRAPIPRPNLPPTEADQQRFARSAFATIKTAFKENLEHVEKGDLRLEFDVTELTATDFRAELFLHGSSKSMCRIWLGGMIGANSNCFSEDRFSQDACSEILAPSIVDNEMSLSATMAMGYSEFELRTNMKKLTPEQAAGYLWGRFTKDFR